MNISMAFQPIIDIRKQDIFSYEALVRGNNNEGAGQILAQVNADNLYTFDQSCRVKAIEMATRLNMQHKLSINFMPNAVYKPETCIRKTLEASRYYAFPLENIIFEISESEKVTNVPHLKEIIRYYKECGFTISLDDFGSYYANLDLLADLDMDIIKLDMTLIRNIDQDKKRQTVVENACRMCRSLGHRVIAEGIETEAEFHTLYQLGLNLYQGYYFARPGFESLPDIHCPRLSGDKKGSYHP